MDSQPVELSCASIVSSLEILNNMRLSPERAGVLFQELSSLIDPYESGLEIDALLQEYIDVEIMIKKEGEKHADNLAARVRQLPQFRIAAHFDFPTFFFQIIQV